MSVVYPHPAPTAEPVNTTRAPEIHDTRPALSTAQPNLWQRIAIACRTRGYSLSTERTYVHWAKTYSQHHGRRHPRDMGAAEVQAFLNYLAVDREVAPSTAKQALCAIVFLYRHVLGVDLPWLDGLQHPKGLPRLPVVLSRDEVAGLLRHTTGTPGLVLRLLYGTGMRMMEALRLRVQDLDLSRHTITIREGKGGKDRTTMVPASLVPELRAVPAARRARRAGRECNRRRGAARSALRPPWVAGPGEGESLGANGPVGAVHHHLDVTASIGVFMS